MKTLPTYGSTPFEGVASYYSPYRPKYPASLLANLAELFNTNALSLVNLKRLQGRRQGAEGFVQTGIGTPPEREPPFQSLVGAFRPLLPFGRQKADEQLGTNSSLVPPAVCRLPPLVKLFTEDLTEILLALHPLEQFKEEISVFVLADCKQ